MEELLFLLGEVYSVKFSISSQASRLLFGYRQDCAPACWVNRPLTPAWRTLALYIWSGPISRRVLILSHLSRCDENNHGQPLPIIQVGVSLHEGISWNPAETKRLTVWLLALHSVRTKQIEANACTICYWWRGRQAVHKFKSQSQLYITQSFS